MKKKKSVILSIDKPCSENWDNMTPNEGGRHCANCNKAVVDFSNYTDRELLDFLSKTKENICGRLSPYQLERPIISYEPNNNSLLQKFMLGTALATSLAACNESKTNNTTQTTEQKQVVVGALEMKTTADNAPKSNYITGTVIDDKDHTPISKMMVGLKGTKQYAITDIDGHFKVEVPDSLKGQKIILVFSDMNKVSQYKSKKVEYVFDKMPMEVKVKLHNTYSDSLMKGTQMTVPPPMVNGGLTVRSIPDESIDSAKGKPSPNSK
ncbi:MAG TPA: hypothetical protein VK806_06640 [Bacteroidia bacterium]|jgi:hypothetical protein|nr:hypothetical protein [Bacteroidia bacterium]